MSELMRLKNALALPLVYGLNEPAVEDNPNWPRYIRITDFNEDGNLNDDTFKSVPPHKANGAYLRKGDILLARSGATVGKAFCFNEEIKACFAGYLIRARLNKKRVYPQYFSFITRSTYYSDWKNQTNIQTTIQNISAEKYNQFEFPCPSLLVQQRIVDYLDAKLSEIDKRVSVLEKQQDAYARLKKSIIHQAVTRGLNPDVRLKDSGIEWIEMIPEYWEVKRLKDVVSVNAETLTENTLYNYTFQYIDISNVSSEGKINLGESITFDEAPSRARRKVKKGDVLVSTVRTYLRAIARIDFNAKDIIASTGFAVLSPKKGIDSSFIAHAVRDANIVDAICCLSTGVSYPAISASRLSSISIAIPPLAEQQAIATYLDEKCAKIDAAIENIGKQIEASKRLKRAIINEAISGKTTI